MKQTEPEVVLATTPEAVADRHNMFNPATPSPGWKIERRVGDRTVDLSDRHDPAPPIVRQVFRKATTADVVAAVDGLDKKLQSAIERYVENKDKPDTRLQDVQFKIDELVAALKELEAQKAQLEAEGTYLTKFANVVRSAENQASGASASLIQAKGEDAAQKNFGVSADKLSSHTKKDLQLRWRMKLEKFASRAFLRLTHNQEPTEEQLFSVCDRVLSAIDEIKAVAKES
jgi:hypothetical protein